MQCFGITGKSSYYIAFFLTDMNKFYEVVKSSTWASILAGVPQGSILGPLNNLSKSISSTTTIFAHDTSLFSFANDITVSEQVLNSEKFLYGPINGRCQSIKMYQSKPKR